MAMLNDECLFKIFTFLNPLAWATVAQVCTKWERVAQKMRETVTAICLNDELHYSENGQLIEEQFPPKNEDEIKSAVEYIGSHVKLLKLGCCEFNTVFCLSEYGYCGTGKAEVLFLDKIASVFSETCTNVEELQIGRHYKDSANVPWQLMQSNKKLKKLVFLDTNLMTHPSSSMTIDSVEEVVWEIRTLNNVVDFALPFPNLTKMTLVMLYGVRFIVSKILQRVEFLKSLTILLNYIYDIPVNFNAILSDIVALNQLEELHIVKRRTNRFYMSDKQVLSADSISRLVENCQKLRVVEFDSICLQNADISCFLLLPELKELTIRGARVFSSTFISKIGFNQFEHLTRLKLEFVRGTTNVSGLSTALRKMPVLNYLQINGLTDDQALDLTCIAIASAVLLEKDIVVHIQEADDAMGVHKKEKPELELEPLRLSITSQDDDYEHIVYNFVDSLEEYSIVRGRVFHVDQDEMYNKYWKMVECCQWD